MMNPAMRALAVLVLAGCSAVLPPSSNTPVLARCTAFSRIIGEAKLYDNTVKLEAHGTFTEIEVTNELALSPINAWIAGHHALIAPGHSQRWQADSRFVDVRQALLSYVPGKVTLKATVCR